MAAVLCNACGEITSSICSITGQLCRLPAQLCGASCSACGSLCEQSCHSLSSGLCASPFAIFVTVAAVFNVPSVYVGLMGVLEEGVSCKGARWLLVHAFLCAVNIVAAIYMGVAVVKEVHQDNNNTSMAVGQQTPKTAFARAGHLLCYDPLLAVYILVLLAFFVWLWTGAAWSLSGSIHQGCSSSSNNNNADGGDDNDGVAGKVAVALGFGWAFIFFGMASLCLGMCCAYMWDSSGDGNNNASSIPYGDQETPYVNAASAAEGTSSKPMSTASVYDSTKPLSVPTVAATPTTPTTKSDPPTAQAVLF